MVVQNGSLTTLGLLLLNEGATGLSLGSVLEIHGEQFNDTQRPM